MKKRKFSKMNETRTDKKILAFLFTVILAIWLAVVVAYLLILSSKGTELTQYIYMIQKK